MSEPIYLISQDQFEQLKQQLDLILEHLELDQGTTKRKWISAQETCDLLQIGRTTLYNYGQTKKLIPSRVGRKLYYNIEDIEKLLMKKTG
jgi:hypothetical protein